MQLRHPKGVSAGGQFAPQSHAEPEISLAPSSEDWGMGRFVFSPRPPETVRVANDLLGAGASMAPGAAWDWWQSNGSWEEMDDDVELWTSQGSLRGDQIVEDLRKVIQAKGPLAVFDPPPHPDYIDEDFDVSGFPKLVRLDGKLWVLDGHHRLTAAEAEGVSATVLVADLDAYREKVAASDPWPMPDGEDLVDHIAGHFENDSFSGDVEVVDDPAESDGVEFVTVEELEEWHAWAHQLGLSDHHHG